MLVEDVSSNDILEEKSRETRDAPRAPPPQPFDMDTINELELALNKNDPDDLQELGKILTQILNYPQSKIAEIHKQSMRLGNFDLQDQEKTAFKIGKARLDTSSEMMEGRGSEKKEYCPCCGFIKQQDNIKMCTSLDGIKNMGLSTYLFFATFKNLCILLVIMVIVYSLFALLTNLIASGYIYNRNSGVVYITAPIVAISLSPKELINNQTNQRYYYISCWSGVGMILIWIIALIGIKYKQVKDSQEYDQDTISCSDYSIVIQGFPMGVQIKDLQQQFNKYYETSIKNNSRLPAVWKQPLTIAKLNIGKPFYLNEESLKDEEIENIDKQLEELRQKMRDLVKERRNQSSFSLPKEQREAMYDRYFKLQQRKIQKCAEMHDKISKALKNEHDNTNTTVFVTFDTNNAKTVMNFIHDTGIINKLRGLCSAEHRRFSFTHDGKDLNLDIRRAPEPEDILWHNIGHNDCAVYCRKFFTFSVTALLLGISFGIVFGLTKLQLSNNDNPKISIAISATIGIINPILGIVIKFLTYFEKDYTTTYREGSLAVKSIVAQMINSIVIPVVTAYKIKEDVYSDSGLVNNIFMLGITTTIVPPLILMIDPFNLFMKIMRCIKSRPASKLYQTQKEHNAIHEGIQFEIGYHYIYIANAFMFTCFFVSLQPIVSVFALLGYFFMYWVQKYCVFNRYRRPVPGTDFVNNAVWRIIFLGPLIYSLGSMTWSNLAPNGIPPEAILPNLVAVGMSIIVFLIPMNTIIYGSCFSSNYQTVKKYHDERIFFPSEYDRLNPSTQKEGIEEYTSYMVKKMEELKGAPKEKQDQFAYIMNHNAQRAQMNQRAIAPQMGGAFTTLFGGPQFANFMPQPQPNFMASFMPMIPGYQPNFRPNSGQALVIRGGQVSAAPINPYPQYQHQQRPVFGPTGAQVSMSPPPRVQPQPQVQMVPQFPPQTINLSNPLEMMNIGRQVMNQNPVNPMQAFGFGGLGNNNNHQRSRRF